MGTYSIRFQRRKFGHRRKSSIGSHSLSRNNGSPLKWSSREVNQAKSIVNLESARLVWCCCGAGGGGGGERKTLSGLPRYRLDSFHVLIHLLCVADIVVGRTPQQKQSVYVRLIWIISLQSLASLISSTISFRSARCELAMHRGSSSKSSALQRGTNSAPLVFTNQRAQILLRGKTISHSVQEPGGVGG